MGEVFATLQELKASRVHARKAKAHPCDLLFSAQTDSVCHIFRDLQKQARTIVMIVINQPVQPVLAAGATLNKSHLITFQDPQSSRFARSICSACKSSSAKFWSSSVRSRPASLTGVVNHTNQSRCAELKSESLNTLLVRTLAPTTLCKH